eukprot:COSAG01_NODE_403_length_17482_cov_77.249597_17_plen_112_part_00
MRTPSPVPQHAFAYKVDRRLSSALGEVASSHRPEEWFLIDHQCPLWGGAVGTAARRPAPAGQLVIVIGELGAALRLFRAEDHSKDSQSFDDQHPYPCLDDLLSSTVLHRIL